MADSKICISGSRDTTSLSKNQRRRFTGKCIRATDSIKKGDIFHIEDAIVSIGILNGGEFTYSDEECKEDIHLDTRKHADTFCQVYYLTTLIIKNGKAAEIIGLDLEENHQVSDGRDKFYTENMSKEEQKIASLIRRNIWTDMCLSTGSVFTTGVWKTGCFLNNCCISYNTSVVFNGKRMYLVATKDIAKDQEILVSYQFVPFFNPYDTRKRIYEITKNFTCRCIDCQTKSSFSKVFESYFSNFNRMIKYTKKEEFMTMNSLVISAFKDITDDMEKRLIAYKIIQAVYACLMKKPHVDVQHYLLALLFSLPHTFILENDDIYLSVLPMIRYHSMLNALLKEIKHPMYDDIQQLNIAPFFEKLEQFYTPVTLMYRLLTDECMGATVKGVEQHYGLNVYKTQ